jgi:hypothetical protein
MQSKRVLNFQMLDKAIAIYKTTRWLFWTLKTYWIPVQTHDENWESAEHGAAMWTNQSTPGPSTSQPAPVSSLRQRATARPARRCHLTAGTNQKPTVRETTSIQRRIFGICRLTGSARYLRVCWEEETHRLRIFNVCLYLSIVPWLCILYTSHWA